MERTLQGSLTFLGFAIAILAVFYFAIEYIPRVSEWSQLAALILLGLAFAFLGVWLRTTVVGEPFFDGPRLRWLRPSIVMYLLALFCGVVAEIRFLSMDDVSRPLKILASLVVAVALIVGVASRRSKTTSPTPAASTAVPRGRPARRPTVSKPRAAGPSRRLRRVRSPKR